MNHEIIQDELLTKALKEQPQTISFFFSFLEILVFKMNKISFFMITWSKRYTKKSFIMIIELFML